MKYYILLLMLGLVVGCKQTTPKNILPPNKMEDILIEQFKADAFTKEYLAKDSSLDLAKENFIIQEKIFKKYKTDKNTFYQSYKYYLQHDNLFSPILDSIMTREGKRRESERYKNLLKSKNEQIKK